MFAARALLAFAHVLISVAAHPKIFFENVEQNGVMVSAALPLWGAPSAGFF